MLYTHVVALATLALCVAEESKRPARNPGLLHLAHAGHSVGSYVAAEDDHGGAAGGGAGGPHILIYGGHPRVSTRVVSKDSLEELDEDIRQYQQQQPVRYVPNSSYRGGYFEGQGRDVGYAGYKDAPAAAPQYTPGHDYPGPSGAPPAALAYPRTYGHFGAPVLYSPPLAHAPLGHGFPGISTFVGHPVHQQGGVPQHSPTPTQSHAQQRPAGHQGATPATVNYATPTSYPLTPTATPLTHALSSPALLPSRAPLYHPLQAPVPLAHHGLGYQNPLGHGPVFLPVQAFHQPHSFFHNQGQLRYSPQSAGEGRNSYRDEQGSDDEERQNYYRDSQERRPLDYQGSHQYDEDESSNYSRENNYQKSYNSDESLPKSAATPAFQTYQSDDTGSYEDTSNEGRAEKSPYKYSFADDHTKGRSAALGDGEGKVATSYQSVTFETHHPVPRHYPKQNPH